MDESLREKRRLAGKLGGLACVAKHGKAAMARQLRANHDRAYERLVDPTGILDSRDRAERAKALADMQLARARRLRTSPCAWCLAERGIAFPADKSSSICARHAKEETRKARIAVSERHAA